MVALRCAWCLYPHPDDPPAIALLCREIRTRHRDHESRDAGRDQDEQDDHPRLGGPVASRFVLVRRRGDSERRRRTTRPPPGSWARLHRVENEICSGPTPGAPPGDLEGSPPAAGARKEKTSMLGRIFGTVVALAAAVILVKSIPDLARYLKIREM